MTKTVFLNEGKNDVHQKTLLENGLRSVSLIDEKYLEVVDGEGKEALRTYYLTKTGTGHFYLNDTRYKIDAIREVLPKTTRGSEEGEPRKEEEPTKEEPKKSEDGVIKHREYETIKSCVELDIPVYLVGEAGTGKNYTLEAIAKDLGLDFYFTNSVQQEYKLTGFIDAGGTYHETEFYKAFRFGGVFFLDEIDASIPEVLVLLNAAIANRYFEFPVGRIEASPSFRVVSAGNTMGSGANELYTGRLVLDSATLDRFAVIEFDYDYNVELSLAKGNKELVNFIRSLRKFTRENGIRATFSYRSIIAVTKLEESKKLDLASIVRIAVTKGLDKDTIRTLRVENSGRYHYALEEVKKGA
jgi:cobaltochelatase CobS